MKAKFMNQSQGRGGTKRYGDLIDVFLTGDLKRHHNQMASSVLKHCGLKIPPRSLEMTLISGVTIADRDRNHTFSLFTLFKGTRPLAPSPPSQRFATTYYKFFNTLFQKCFALNFEVRYG